MHVTYTMKRNRSTAECIQQVPYVLPLSVTVTAKESKNTILLDLQNFTRELVGRKLYSDTVPLMLTKKPTLAVEEKKEKHLEEGETEKGNST